MLCVQINSLIPIKIFCVSQFSRGKFVFKQKHNSLNSAYNSYYNVRITQEGVLPADPCGGRKYNKLLATK